MSIAHNVTPDSRIGATWRASKTVRHLWARRSDGHLSRLELASDTDDEVIWADQMPLGSPAAVHARGLDAISFTNGGGGEEEHVAYVGTDNQIYDWRLINGTPQVAQYLSVPAPAGQTLTGHIAVGRRLDRVFFFVSTVLGRLYRYEVTNWNTASYSISAAITGVSTTAMISATGPTSGTYVRVFFSKSDNTVWQYKFDGGAWTSVSFAGPDAPNAPNPSDRAARQCDLAAATEGQIGATAGYRTYLFCTRAGGTPHNVTLYYRYASNSGGTNFGAAWSTKSVPLGAIATSGFGLTSRRRAEGGGSTLEAFFLGSVVTNNLFHIEHTANAANLGSVANMGWDGETSGRRGGITCAGDEARGFSDAYFVGQAQDSSWLYRKFEDDNGDVTPFEWVNYGAADGWKTYSAGSSTPSPTESSTAILGGRVIIAAIYSDDDLIATDKVIFSDDEGATFTAPVTTTPPVSLPYWLPDPPGGSAPSWGDSAFDPVADFDDAGKAYISELRTALQADGTSGGNGVLLWSTSTGPLTFEQQIYGSIEKPDHPWIAVYRNRQGLDRIHMTWLNQNPPSLLYTQAPVNNLAALASNVVTLETGGVSTSAPRVTVSQADGTAYVAWTHGICRVNPAYDGSCDALLGYGEDYTPDTAWSGSGSELQFPNTNNTFRAVRCFSVVADPSNQNRVYYAFQKREPGVAEGYGPFDLYVAKLDYAFGGIDPGPRILLNIQADDGMHQTMPEVTVSQDGPFPLYRMIFATWYDWNNVTCTVGGQTYQGTSWADSRCYQVYMARSVDFGLSWETIPHVFPTVSDPALLPERVFNGVPTERFLGDYHAVTGDILHSAHVAITAPVGGSPQVTNIERGWVSHGYWNATD